MRQYHPTAIASVRQNRHRKSLGCHLHSGREPAITDIKLEVGKLTVLGRSYYLWLSRLVPENGKLKSWEFSADARGRWYVNIQVELPEPEKRNAPPLGIDLGLKSVVALSNGFKIAAPRLYRQEEKQLGLLRLRRVP
jgi:transposase